MQPLTAASSLIASSDSRCDQLVAKIASLDSHCDQLVAQKIHFSCYCCNQVVAMGAVEKEIFFATSWWHREFEDASFFAQKSDQATVFMADGGPLEHIYFCTTKALGGGEGVAQSRKH